MVLSASEGTGAPGHTSFQEFPHSLRASPTGGFFQHDLCLEGLKVEFLRLQCLNKPVTAVDPSLGLCKRVDYILQFGDDRRHSFPRAD